MTAIDILTLLLVTLVWGVNFAVVKIGLAQLPPILFVSAFFSSAMRKRLSTTRDRSLGSQPSSPCRTTSGHINSRALGGSASRRTDTWLRFSALLFPIRQVRES